MALNGDFSSNCHTASSQEYEVLTRHPELSFEDANIAIVTGRQYFLVHQGLLCHHSLVLRQSVDALQNDDEKLLEGRRVLSLQDLPEDMAHFLRALYGFYLNLESMDFDTARALLRTSTKYGVDELRKEAIRVLTLAWPNSLAQWELREKKVTSPAGVYSPRPALPHPILVINLAREAIVPELLPSAFYDLSRYLPSQLASGYNCTPDGNKQHLSFEDLQRVLRGKEQAARFFSTFIVNELEGRDPSAACIRRNETHLAMQRACQVAFEAINFELIRDVNSMVCNRNSDPLFAIADSVLMQTREDMPGVENKAIYRPCEACRLEYGAVVDAVRADFWRRIPGWFELELFNASSGLPAICQSSESKPAMSLVETDMTADYEIELYSHSDLDDASDDLFIENEGADEVMLFDAGIEEDEELDVHYVGPQRDQCETLHRFDEDFDADVQDESTGSEAHSDAEIDERHRGQSIERLESLVLSLLSQLVASLPSDIDSQAKCSKGKKIVVQVADRRKSSIDGATATREIKFPQRSRGPSIKPIAQLFKVVNLMHEALVNNVPTTKRDMYYKDVELFKSQSVVDRLVDDVAASLNLGRADLGVRASSKGLIAGSGLIIHLEEGGTIDINDNEVRQRP
ncbi:hypothetical protein WOLCODRAFT_90460 [Wolfiporia cocos MD-104 SS10]|uniref:Spo11/DNA topoisomerase VI subunit A N-terminal domain-containing protein n=1 Tax=Wolfiporia cocos (strain MD-104) TaxID=742152 RepID=A0A2H3K0U3_WOLCO|nr:hypothetical protein WOLCODRAFT_90460 [Wolfiporia cocos MD-104 SS10]